MSRLAKRLGRLKRKPKQNQLAPREPYPYDEEGYYYNDEDQYYDDDYYEDEEEYETQEVSPLVNQYDDMQRKLAEYEKEMQAMEATNPHMQYKEIVTKHSDKGAFKKVLFGRPIDLSKLENYIIYKISPRTVTTLMRYNDSKSIEEVKGYSKRPPFRAFKSGLIWIILGAIVLLGLGFFILTQGQNLTGMMRGIFGM